MPLIFIVFCGSIVLSLGLGLMTVKRCRSLSGIEAFATVFVITLSGVFFSTMIYLLTSNTYARLSYPSFQAIIIDYESETDEDNLLMHRAILQFTDLDGETITRPSQLSSSIRPKIGNARTIYYQDEHLYEPSISGMITFLIFIPLTGAIVFAALRIAIRSSRITTEY